MKKILLAGIAFVAISSANAQEIPQDYSVNEFLQVCETPNAFHQGFCAGVINGVEQTMTCPTETSNLLATTEEILSWMRGDIKILTQPTGKTIKKALISLYGCSEKLPAEDEDLNLEDIPGEVEL